MYNRTGWVAFDDERRFWEGEVRRLDKLVA